MTPKDRFLSIWTYVTGFGLSLLGMAAGVLSWPDVVQFTLAMLVIAVPVGTLLAVSRARRRR